MAKVSRPNDEDIHLDEVVEVQPARPVDVPLTKTLYHLAPTMSDAGQTRRIAIVAAESEAKARVLATTHDPFGYDWMNAQIFCARLSNSRSSSATWCSSRFLRSRLNVENAQIRKANRSSASGGSQYSDRNRCGRIFGGAACLGVDAA